MCTFNIALDDNIVEKARKSFPDENSFTAWMEEQITLLLRNYVVLPNHHVERKRHKHDTLMGVISDVPNIDIKESHIKEKYSL